jgi:hypothetical protein
MVLKPAELLACRAVPPCKKSREHTFLSGVPRLHQALQDADKSVTESIILVEIRKKDRHEVRAAKEIINGIRL